MSLHYKLFLALLVLMFSTGSIAGLEIQVKQTKIELPYWPSALKNKNGAVLMVHGGQGPMSAVMERTAQQLSKLGWSVAILNYNQKKSLPLDEQLPQALLSLRKKNRGRVVLIHYGEHLQKSLNYFSKPQSKQVNGLVMLSAYNLDRKPLKTPSLRFPLLDIAGQFDYEPVLNQMQLREKKYRNKSYLAMTLSGASHDYLYHRLFLSYYLHGWMSQLPVPDRSRHPLSVSYIPNQLQNAKF